MKAYFDNETVKCPACGHGKKFKAFTQAALGRIPFQALRHRQVGYGYGRKKDGSRGGAVIWTRRALTRAEAEHLARALAMSLERMVNYLDGDAPDAPDPLRVLQEIDSDDEAEELLQGWIKEAEDEVQARHALFEDEMRRRGVARGDEDGRRDDSDG